MIEIIVYNDYVLIEGQQVNRPKSISVIQWLNYWEDVQNIAELKQDIRDLKDELEKMETY